MLRHCNRIRRQRGNGDVRDIEEGEGYPRTAGHARVRARHPGARRHLLVPGDVARASSQEVRHEDC